jgi:ribosomal protein S21
MRIVVRNNNLDKALRVFKNKTADKIWDYKSKEFYEKPSVHKHRARKAAIKREERRNKKNDNRARNKF